MNPYEEFDRAIDHLAEAVVHVGEDADATLADLTEYLRLRFRHQHKVAMSTRRNQLQLAELARELRRPIKGAE